VTHSTLHFAFGFTLGFCVCLPNLLRRWKHGQPLFNAMLWQSVLSLMLGFLAALPSLLAHIGVSREVFKGAWANIFCLYPIVHTLGSQGKSITGPVVILVLFAAEYFLTILAICRAGRLSTPQRASSATEE